MRRILVVLVCAVGASGIPSNARLSLPCALGREDAGEKADKKELAALQGTWKCLRIEEGGKLVETKGTHMIDGHKLTFNWSGDTGKGRMSINASMEPKHLDIEFESGQTDVTIYVRSGDYVIQCGNRDGKTRPTKFATGVEGGGDYRIVWKIQR